MLTTTLQIEDDPRVVADRENLLDELELLIEYLDRQHVATVIPQWDTIDPDD